MTAAVDPAESAESLVPGRRLGYLPGLDGLRALSLVAILLFHGGFFWARGGFLGVSVFFTLSGFLVTSVLMADRGPEGRLRVRAFYARRARRLMPAVVALLLLVAIIVAAGGLASSGGLRGDAVASSLWVSNWRFVLSGDSYGAVFGDPSPFQHMWSLAVEEQFYLLLPLTLVLLFRLRGMARRWGPPIAIAVGIALSTWLCATLYVGTATGRAYFGTDTRMAEPLVGVLLALLLIGPTGLRQLPMWAQRVTEAASVLGIAGLGYLVVHLGQYDPRLYHGGFLLVALLATPVIVAATQPTTWVSKALSLRPLAAIGRVSYGGYLYHWPLFLWLSPERVALSPWPLFELRCSVTLLVATASYRWLEQPILHGRLRPRLALPAWAGTSIAAIAAVSVLTPAVLSSAFSAVFATNHHSAPAPAMAAPGGAAPLRSGASPGHGASRHIRARVAATPSASKAAAARRTQNLSSYSSSSSSNLASEPVPSAPPTATASGPQLRVAIIGDSMADGLGKALIQWANGRSDVLAYNLSGNGCPLAYGGTERFPDGFERDVSGCGWWADPSSNRSIDMQKFQPQVVVVQDGGNEMVDRKLPNWATYEGPGDGIYDNWMLGMYHNVFQTVTTNSAPGVQIVHLNAVCGNWSQNQHWGNAGNPQGRVASVNFDYSTLSGANYSLNDYDSVLCPNNQFTNNIYGVSRARPDGYHLSPAAALAVVNNWLGPLVLQKGSVFAGSGSSAPHMPLAASL